MDDFQKPQPHRAPSRAAVNAVLSRASETGNLLLSLLAVLLAAVLALYAGYMLYDSYYTQDLASRTAFDLLQYRPEVLDDGMTPLSGGELLSSISEDYRAWLTMYDTNIDYPVMQGEDDLYYASHDVYGGISLTGAIYLAADNSPDGSDSYNLIYGHHMDNGAMFGALDAFTDPAYLAGHRDGALVTDSGVYDLHVFAVAATDAYESRIYTVGNKMNSVLDFLRRNYAASDGTTSVLFFDEAALEGAERIAALSTCASAETNGRLVVFATMTRRNLLTLWAEGYDGVYDAKSHGPERVVSNYPDDTVFSYSTDGGQTWIEGLPELRDDGELTVILRAENERYGTATATVTLRIAPRPIVIKARDAFKTYGEDDPAWEIEPISGLVDEFEPVYTVIRSNAGVEDVGVYAGVLTPQGESLQGNYSITYLPGDFQITQADSLAMIVEGYTGVYDTLAHGLNRLELNVPVGTLIEYSLDGGATWTTAAPTITNVGTLQVLIRATNPNYDPITAEALLQVTPAQVVVTARSAEKNQGEDDPAFEAEVTGVLDGTVIAYEITRPGAGSEEEPGSYPGAIVPAGEAFQGNYQVTYVAGELTIHALPEEVLDEPETPLGQFFGRFTPSPWPDTPVWALLNLICLVVTAYVVAPLLHLKAKFRRAKRMREANEELDREGRDDEERYDVKRFVKRFRIGMILEILALCVSLVLFLLTEDMTRPMVFIDGWTPVMLLLLALCLVLDLRLARYRQKKPKEQAEEKQA